MIPLPIAVWLSNYWKIVGSSSRGEVAKTSDCLASIAVVLTIPMVWMEHQFAGWMEQASSWKA